LFLKFANQIGPPTLRRNYEKSCFLDNMFATKSHKNHIANNLGCFLFALQYGRITHFRKDSQSTVLREKSKVRGNHGRGNGKERLPVYSPDNHSPDCSLAFFSLDLLAAPPRWVPCVPMRLAALRLCAPA
jgi:hypothetical protein